MRIGHSFVTMRVARSAVRFENKKSSASDVWPEVSSHYSQDELDCAAAENSPGRVFLEVVLVLGIAGLAAIAAAIWAPILS